MYQVGNKDKIILRCTVNRISRNEVKISYFIFCGCSYIETDPTGVLSPNNWPNKIGLFGADSLARHLLQSARDSSAGTMGVGKKNLSDRTC